MFINICCRRVAFTRLAKVSKLNDTTCNPTWDRIHICTYSPPYDLIDSSLYICIYLVRSTGGLVGSSQRSDGGRPAQGARQCTSYSTEGSGSSSISCSWDIALHHRLGTNTHTHSTIVFLAGSRPLISFK